MPQDNFSPKGELTLTLTDKNGKVKNTHTQNLVVTSGRNWIVERMGNDADVTANVMTHIAVGEGNADVELENLALDNEAARAEMEFPGGNVEGGNVIVYRATFGPTEGTGALIEAGIFDAAIDGTMLSRASFPEINKQQDDTLNIIWRVRIQ